MKRKREERGRTGETGREGEGEGSGRVRETGRREEDERWGRTGGTAGEQSSTAPSPPPPIPHPAAASARSWRSSQSAYELRLKLYRNYFQTKPSAVARLNRKFSTTAVSLRCFSDSKVTLAFPPSSGSTASFLRLLMRSFVLTDSS